MDQQGQRQHKETHSPSLYSLQCLEYKGYPIYFLYMKLNYLAVVYACITFLIIDLKNKEFIECRLCHKRIHLYVDVY